MIVMIETVFGLMYIVKELSHYYKIIILGLARLFQNYHLVMIFMTIMTFNLIDRDMLTALSSNKQK